MSTAVIRKEAGAGRLNCYDFGRALLDAGDLDPIYTVIWGARLPRLELLTWLTAYLCYYHVGTASWCVDQEDFWGAMATAAASPVCPRGTERRHFRGAAATASVAWLRAKGVPRLWAFAGRPRTVAEVMKEVGGWRQFGPWIAFKAADMLERLDVCPVSFDDGAAFLFDSPRKGARDLWEYHNAGLDPDREPGGVGRWAVGRVLEELGPLPAPPRGERPLNCQEAETILCKWHSYLGGHYVVGKDVAEVRHALTCFGRRSRTARRLYAAGKDAGLWGGGT